MTIWMDVDSAVVVPVNVMPLIDDTDFKTVEDAIAYNAAGMDLRWNFVTPAGVTTSTAITPTTSGDYDWSHLGDGMYAIELPASGGASVNNDTEGFGWFSGRATGVLPWRGPVIGFRAAAINDALIEGTAAPSTLDAAGVRTAVGLASANLDTQLGAIDSNVDAILADTGTDGVVVASGSKTGYSLSADQSGVTVGTVNALGTQAKADVNAEVDAALADYDAPTKAELDAAVGPLATSAALETVDGNVDAIKAKTDNLPSDPADQSLIIAATEAIIADTEDIQSKIGTPAGASMSADIAAIKSETADILTDTGTTLDGKLDTIDGVVDGIKAVTDALPDSGALTSLATAAALTTVDTVVDGIAVQTSRVDALIEDSTGDRFTAKALEAAPTGGSAPTASQIADAVWDEDLSTHTTEGSAGDTLGSVATGTPPTAQAIREEIDANSTKLAAIEADTQDLQTQIGTAGAGLTALGDTRLANLDAAVSTRASQASVDTVDGVVDAILLDTAAIDGRLPSDPADQSLIIAATNAIVADTEDIQAKLGTPAGASLAADIAALPDATAVQAAAAAALTAYDPPTRAEATSDKDEVIAAIPSASTTAGAVRTELSTELAHLDADVSSRATPADVPSASTVAAAVASAAASDPLPVNVKEINDAALEGNGTEGSPWGPA